MLTPRRQSDQGSKHCKFGKFFYGGNIDSITEFRATHFHITELQKSLLHLVLQKKNQLLILCHLNWLDAEPFSSFTVNFFRLFKLFQFWGEITMLKKIYTVTFFYFSLCM